MIWALTKASHELSCSYWVRWWLRQTMLRRLIVVAIVTVVWGLLSFGIIAATSSPATFYAPASASPWTFLGWFTWLFPLFWLIDGIWDRFGTRSEIRDLEAQRDVVLATRGEYRGGHPKLPRARFVYLTLGGTLEQPELTILLPQGAFQPSLPFRIPVMDVARTRSLLTHVISQNSVLGKEPIFEIEYQGDSGRKQRVELSHFFYGAEEVYLWRNFVVCIQAEADTGEVPFGRWKSLPKEGTPADVPLGAFAPAQLSQ